MAKYVGKTGRTVGTASVLQSARWLACIFKCICTLHSALHCMHFQGTLPMHSAQWLACISTMHSAYCIACFGKTFAKCTMHVASYALEMSLHNPKCAICITCEMRTFYQLKTEHNIDFLLISSHFTSQIFLHVNTYLLLIFQHFSRFFWHFSDFSVHFSAFFLEKSK